MTSIELPPVDSPAQDVAQLSAEYPIALLPVRIETRFGTSDGKPSLRVRVYPDEIMADGHEPELTADEKSAGENYWKTGWVPAEEVTAWRALLVRYNATRAAWIVRATTPTNLTDRPASPPIFPSPALKAGTWTRAVEARVLPDRWVVVCFRDGVAVHRAVGSPIPDPLTLTVSPALDANDTTNVTDISGDGLLLDTALLWTVDFSAAEAVGMGITVGIGDADLQLGFDRVLVYGVKASLQPSDSAARLQALLDAHHFDRGLAFVAQGTPTNNTSDAAAGFPPKDPNGASSFAVERGTALAVDGSSGAAFTTSLGIAIQTADHIGGADRDEQRSAQAMNRAMWPLTWGYFLEQLLDPLVTPATVDAVRQFFVTSVRGRGPLPAFRVGSVPYGLLPVSSLSRWQVSREANAVDRFLPGLLRRLVAAWKSEVGSVPHVGRGDPDQALLDILAEDASAREVWIRPLLGNDAADNLARFLEVPWPTRVTRQRALVADLQDLWGADTRVPRAITNVFYAGVGRFKFPLVSAVLSETEPLDFNYLQWIGSASVSDLRTQQLPDGVAPPTSLLYRLARHGVLLEYRKAAHDALDRFGMLQAGERREIEMVDIVPGTSARPTVWQRLDAPIAALTGNASLATFFHDAVVVGGTQTSDTAHLAEQYVAVKALESLPTAELDRLFTETLDCCSHRVDAWVTALATERLNALRSAQPTGVHLGAFAWVENLRPVAARQTRTLPGGRSASIQPADGGFIHAPSMTHASAAAVLRNGYLSRSGPGQQRYAIDISSARVRQARWLLGAMREGQSLRALLGYQFERGLHERELERYIEPFRVLYPLPERDTPPTTGPTEGLSPRDVVDGLTLREEADADRIPFSSNPDLPHADPDLSGVEAELALLSQTFDAVSDLLTAEAVYQLVRGTTMGASASMDAQAQGVRPPDPEVVRVPRGGIPLTHRVALVLGGDPLPDNWSGVSATPRSDAEPYLDRWLATLIGDPTKVQCRVRFADPQPGDPNHVAIAAVTLQQLALRPLDVLSLAANTELDDDISVLDPGTATPLADGSPLDRRIVVAALGAVPAPLRYEVLYAADTGWLASGIRTFPEILELLRAIQEVVGKSRPLTAADLLPPEIEAATALADELTAEADTRASDAFDAVVHVRSVLETQVSLVPEPTPGDPEPDVTALRAALFDAVQYGAASFPPLPLPDAASERRRLVSLAQLAAKELARREAAATAAVDAADKMSAIFGRDFIFLPRFKPGSSVELQAAINYSPSLVPGNAIKTQWLQQLRRVRQPLAAWGRVELYARCVGAPLAPLDLVQLPHANGAQWIGLPFQPDATPAARRTSIAMFRAGQPQAADPWVGLWLDEWNETIPSPIETTAIGFHYDDPGAEAAQTVLLAVSPTNASTWDIESLEAILMETFDLAQIRAVHADAATEAGVAGVPQFAQLLPAIYLAANPSDDTVATDFAGTRIAQATISALVE
ncbi:MAG: hypothetical protein ABJE10_21150 [bacterium]